MRKFYEMTDSSDWHCTDTGLL